MNKGVLQALGAFACYSAADAFLRYGQGTIPPYQFAFIAGIIGFVTLPFLMRPGDKLIDLVRPRSWVVWILRGILGIAGTLFAFYGFGHLPLAEAMSIVFLSPLLTTILARTLLGEKVSGYTWAGTFIGLLGVLIVLTPKFQHLSLGHLAAIGAGLSGAASSILIRYTKDSEKPVTMFGAASLSLIAFSGFMMVPALHLPTIKEWALIVAVGVTGAVGSMLILFAWRNAPVSDVAPTQYSQLIWGLLIGWLVFHEELTASTLIGAFTIVASTGFFLIPAARKT